jgi:enoyl-CoA hydratase/carnithine racemase
VESTEHLTYIREGATAIVTMNRPEAKNAVIGQNGPLAVEAIKRSVRETGGMSEVDGLARELEIGWRLFSTKDAAEGPKAFAEKRPARFTRQ